MKLIHFLSKYFELTMYLSFLLNSSSLGIICWPWSFLVHVHLNLGKKNKLRVANTETDIFLALKQPWVLCISTHGKALSSGLLL